MYKRKFRDTEDPLIHFSIHLIGIQKERMKRSSVLIKLVENFLELQKNMNLKLGKSLLMFSSSNFRKIIVKRLKIKEKTLKAR